MDVQNEPPKAQEIKCYNRIKYNPKQRPTLRTESQTLEVVEITDIDIWLTSKEKVNPGKRVRGVLTLLNGDSLVVEGSVIWRKDNDFGLKFENTQLEAVLSKELRHLVKS